MAERTVFAGKRIRFHNNLPEEAVTNDNVYELDLDDPFEVAEKSPLSEGQQLQKKIWEQEKEG